LTAILHLASPAAPHCFASRPRVIAPNVQGTERLVELALRHDARLLFASSSEVYGLGSGDAQPFREVDPFIDRGHSGRACYAAAKRLGEEIVVAGREHGLDATCLRIFNVYGPGMDPTLPGDGRVVANFLHAVRTRQPLPIHGDGHQVRSFLWIDDFVDAVLALIVLSGPLPPALNVGRDEPVEILELARTLERALGRALSRRLEVKPDEGTRWRCPDASRLRALTGWQPRISLAEGLTRLLHTELRDSEVHACL
jgi:UDP-glucuronate decarboxylase